MEESGDNYTFGVPKWQMFGPRKILTEQEHKNAVQKDLVIPAIHFTTTLKKLTAFLGIVKCKFLSLSQPIKRLKIQLEFEHGSPPLRVRVVFTPPYAGDLHSLSNWISHEFSHLGW